MIKSTSNSMIPRNCVCIASYKTITKVIRLTNSYLAVSQKNKPLFHSIPHHDQQPGERKTNNPDYHMCPLPLPTPQIFNVFFFFFLLFFTTFSFFLSVCFLSVWTEDVLRWKDFPWCIFDFLPTESVNSTCL